MSYVDEFYDACKTNYIKMVHYIIEKNYTEDIDLTKGLILAAEFGNLEIIKYLELFNAEITSEAIILSFRKYKINVFKYLINKINYFDTTLLNNEKITISRLYAQNDIKTLKYFKKKNINIKLKGKYVINLFTNFWNGINRKTYNYIFKLGVAQQSKNKIIKELCKNTKDYIASVALIKKIKMMLKNNITNYAECFKYSNNKIKQIILKYIKFKISPYYLKNSIVYYDLNLNFQIYCYL